MKLGENIKDFLDRFAQSINSNIQNNLGWTTNLKNLVKAESTGADIVISTPLYGIFLDQGTRPHIIEPKGNGVLAFEIGGETIFSKYVSHPGTKANPWIDKSVTLTSSDFDALLNNIAIIISDKMNKEIEARYNKYSCEGYDAVKALNPNRSVEANMNEAKRNALNRIMAEEAAKATATQMANEGFVIENGAIFKLESKKAADKLRADEKAKYTSK